MDKKKEIKLRLDQSDKILLDRIKKDKGMKTYTKTIMSLIHGYGETVKITKTDFVLSEKSVGVATEYTAKIKDDIEEVIHQLQAIGNNINQLATVANSKGLFAKKKYFDTYYIKIFREINKLKEVIKSDSKNGSDKIRKGSS